ncbi:MAG TPA: thiamine pyrophosphate-binding protein [Terriglobia bacterium]|nr:thiamine pyrophosphate-binding protein [Terriglobia bacterium]
MRVADYIAKSVELTGTDTAFMVAGGMMMHLMDAFGRLDRMHYFCNFHEQASAMAADAYARRSGKLGVCLATSGPGATNLLTGMVGAYQDSVPVLFLTGQCKRAETIRTSGIEGLRQCGFLEADIVPIVQSVTKYAAFVEAPERARYHLEKAIHLALSGRPGPVLLDIPLDVQGAPFPENSEPYIPAPMEASAPKTPEIDEILSRLAASKRPLIVAGHGIRCAGMVQTFHSLVELLEIPVATTLMAKDLMPFEHPLFVGHPGPRGERCANFAVQCADFILMVGCSLHIQTTGYEGELFAPRAYKIQIDLDPSLLKRERIGVQAKYQWDLRQYLPALEAQAKRAPRKVPEPWRLTCRNLKARYTVLNEPHAFGEPSDPMNLYEFVGLLSNALSGHETVLTDAGQAHPILGQALRIKGAQRYLNPGSLAEMGWGLPAAFGVAAADPSKPAIAVIGDGSLQTNIQELQTLVHNGFDVKVFVINNSGYASIRKTQQTFFNGYYVGSTPETGVSLPNIEKVAWAYGIPFFRIENQSRATVRIGEVLAQPGPVLCEVMAQKDQRIIPVVPSYMLPDGRLRSKALHEMIPDIGVSFEEIAEAAAGGSRAKP